MPFLRRRFRLVVVPAGLLVAACGAPAPEEVDDQGPPLGEAEEAIAICPWYPPPADVLGDADHALVASSPGTSYWSTSGQRFAVQLDGVNGQAVHAITRIPSASLPTTQAACEATAVKAEVYGLVPGATCWSQYTASALQAQWTPLWPGGPGYCATGLTLSEGNGPYQNTARVRYAVAAATWTALGPMPRPVTVETTPSD